MAVRDRGGDVVTWQVLLVSGASGSGKSSLAYPLATARGAALVEVDDLVVATQSVTTAATHPDLHHWLHHDDTDLSPDEVLARQVALAHALRPAVDAVIANHLDTDLPLVLEGDYLLPEHCAAWPAEVRAVVVHEPDPTRLLHNYLTREPASGPQRKRATDSAHYGDWLAAQARRHAIPVLHPRPWSTARARLSELLS
ncbi:hypothetical protein [Actinosynnema sp. NPDC020468]|uniref:hypothetical protein n=1 Tax=Actinosynnema sp. NPDC020468 TaxID=3154488 RepID=UPI0033DFDFA3